MEEIELSKPSPRQGDGEKRNEGRERVPAIMAFKSTKALWATFALIYVVCFLNSLVGTVVLCLTPHVMSDFSGHSILSVLPMVVRVVSGVLRLPIAKFIDEFGRAHGFLMASGLTILGLFIQALAQSLTETIVAQTLYGIGSNCMDYVLTVIVADMTSLKNRTFVFGIYVTPMLITSFAGPSIAEQLYSRFGWPVAFGSSTVILAAACIPLMVALYDAQRSRSGANETGSITATGQKRSRLRRFAVELDLPGVWLAMSGLLLLLLPLTHPPGTPGGWSTSTFIVMFVSGIVSLIGFTVWESNLALVTCVPWRLLKDRNVLGGCLVVMFAGASAASWGFYYLSYLQVVHNFSIAAAGQIINMHPFAFALFGPIIGLGIRITGDYKFLAFFAGPFLGIFTGLLLVYHGPEAPYDALGTFQSFIGFSMRVFVACSQMAVMVNIEHKDVAAALGVWGTFFSIAVAIGSGLSGAVWTRAVPRVLEHALPADSRNLTEEIAGSLVKQKEYPMGSLIRDAVLAAYWVAQEQMVIMAICFVPVAFACVFMWRNIDVRKQDNGDNAKTRGVIY